MMSHATPQASLNLGAGDRLRNSRATKVFAVGAAFFVAAIALVTWLQAGASWANETVFLVLFVALVVLASAFAMRHFW